MGLVLASHMSNLTFRICLLSGLALIGIGLLTGLLARTKLQEAQSKIALIESFAADLAQAKQQYDALTAEAERLKAENRELREVSERRVERSQLEAVTVELEGLKKSFDAEHSKIEALEQRMQRVDSFELKPLKDEIEKLKEDSKQYEYRSGEAEKKHKEAELACKTVSAKQQKTQEDLNTVRRQGKVLMGANKWLNENLTFTASQKEAYKQHVISLSKTVELSPKKA